MKNKILIFLQIIISTIILFFVFGSYYFFLIYIITIIFLIIYKVEKMFSLVVFILQISMLITVFITIPLLFIFRLTIVTKNKLSIKKALKILFIPFSIGYYNYLSKDKRIKIYDLLVVLLTVVAIIGIVFTLYVQFI